MLSLYACAVIKLDHPAPSPIGQLTHFCPKSLNLLPLLRWPPYNFPWYPWSDAMFSTQHRYPTHFYAPTWLLTPQRGILNPSCWLFLSLSLAEGQTQSQHSINTGWTNNIQYYCIYTIYSRLFFFQMLLIVLNLIVILMGNWEWGGEEGFFTLLVCIIWKFSTSR